MGERIFVTDPRKFAKSLWKKPYARVFIPCEEGGYFAKILEFPGCYAEGDTLQKAMDNLEGVTISWIEAALEQYQDIPQPKQERKLYEV